MGALKDWLGAGKDRRFFYIALILLWFSFSFNAFGAMENDAFFANFKDSESLVVSNVVCKGGFAGGQLAFDNAANTKKQYTCDKSRLKPYYSQFGLQGRMYTFGYDILSKFGLSPAKYIVAAQLATAVLSAAILALFLLWVRKNFSSFVAAVVLVMVSISPMIVGFARNLYWALPLLLLPIVYALYAYPSQKDKRRQGWFWFGLGVVFYLRFLCGYEYVSTIAIAAFAGITYHLYIQGTTPRGYLKTAAVTLCVSLLAFLGAFTTHVVSLSSYTGSVSSSVRIVKERALERTVRDDEYTKYAILGLQTNTPNIYAVANHYLHFEDKQNSVAWSAIAAAINYAFIPVVSLPVEFRQTVGDIIQSSLVFGLVLLLLYRKRHNVFADGDLHRVEALFLAVAVGVLGYMSWLLLASSHALVHAHINGILLYVPAALFGFILIGMAVEHCRENIKGLTWQKTKLKKTTQ